MQLLEIAKIDRSNGALLKAIKGLHNAKVGDIIKIGVEGSRRKFTTRIQKIVGKDRLQDIDGNVFDRSGKIFRRKGINLIGTKGKIIFAKQATQKELDDDLFERKIDFLSKIKWNKKSPEKIDQILKILNVEFGTIQGSRR